MKEFIELIKEAQLLSQLQFNRIEPIIRDAIDSGNQNLEYLESIAEPLEDIVWGLSDIGNELYDEYLNYIESFNPQRAREYRDHNDELNGVYDDLVEVAESLAKEFHKGQVDRYGINFFEGHLTIVGKGGFGWKGKIVGYLHHVAEDTAHTVDEVIQILKDKSNGILRDDQMQELSEALNLLNKNTASSREEYIARIKENFVATRVKLDDLSHNMDISRMPNPTDEDMIRIKRYRREYRQVLEYLGTVAWEWDEGEV
jgi:hypothetical protein